MEVAELATRTPDNRRLALHFHPGQKIAWDSEARIILALGGRQSGKTSFAPYWLAREIQKCGAGDYMVVAPTFPLLSLKAYPEFLKLFRTNYRWGQLAGRQRYFEFNKYGEKAVFGKPQHEPTKIFFGHAQDPESLESATAKAVWIDEGGQKKFKLESFEALRGRVSIHRGRILITTTPYSLNWLKGMLWDKCTELRPSGFKDVEVKVSPDGNMQVVRFESIMNPAFSKEEFEEHRKSLPGWKFDLYYRALFTRPAGVIYEAYDEKLHKVEPFTIPDDWPRYLGLDFGGVHTAGVFLAGEKINGVETGRWFVYREYPEGAIWRSGTAKEHRQRLLQGEPRTPLAYGGAGSEDQWRNEFKAAGLPVKEPPISEVEAGIDRVHAALKQGKLFIFDTCVALLDNISSYSRALDELGNPTEKIEDKETFHFCDALRYIIAPLMQKKLTLDVMTRL